MSSGTENRPFPWLALLTLSGAAFLTVTVELLPAGLLLELSAGLRGSRSRRRGCWWRAGP